MNLMSVFTSILSEMYIKSYKNMESPSISDVVLSTNVYFVWLLCLGIVDDYVTL